MNIATDRTPIGWRAIDEDTYDGTPDSEWPSNCIGSGNTEQEAIDDLCDAMELTYSMKPERAA